jgi:hypothetical protein
MVTSRRQLSFYCDADTGLYLSLIESGIKTKVINRALRDFMQREALIDLDDSKHPTNFWNLPTSTKAQLLKELGGQGEGKADDHLWAIVQETTPQDFYQYAARYLALHQLKFGKPYVMPRTQNQHEPIAAPTEASKPQVKLRKHFYERNLTASPPAQRSTVVVLDLRVENNNRHGRGRKRSLEAIDTIVFPHYEIKDLSDCKYEITFHYEDDADLDKQVYDLLRECQHFADLYNCSIEGTDAVEKGTDRSW